MEDARSLAYKHTVKADAIDERIFSNSEKKCTVYCTISGETRLVQYNFFLPIHRNIIRGALYFRVEPNKDSLAPAVDFFTKDVVEFIESFEWKTK